ncbi:MAG: Fe-S cluster assembly protein SufD [Capsulimonadaceae bacterium]
MTPLADSISRTLDDLIGAETKPGGWAGGLRQQARARFREIGYPTRRDEEWRYTPVAPIAETPFKLAASMPEFSCEQIAGYALTGMQAVELVFVNGRFSDELSTLYPLPKGTVVGSLATFLAVEDAGVLSNLGRYAAFDSQPFVALNTAALVDGAYINIPRNAVVESPIHLLFIATSADGPTAAHPRNLIVAGENSQATIVESYVGLENAHTFTNAVTEIVCARSAVIDHYKIQRESAAAYHVSTTQIQLAAAANFASHSIGFGGALVRNDVNAVLAGEGIECTLNGLYTARDRQHVDNHTSIDHAMPHCNSHELYKGIIDGKGRGVFNGKIFVRQDAQKTDAKQTNQTLLLSDDAQINTKPQLEIYADDVKCTHGATVGQLSDEAMFYLRSRGIDKDVARELLIYAFAADIVHRIKIEPIRAQLDHVLLSERALEGIE